MITAVIDRSLNALTLNICKIVGPTALDGIAAIFSRCVVGSKLCIHLKTAGLEKRLHLCLNYA